MSAVLVAQERWAEAEVNLQAAVSASLPRLAWSKALAHTQLQLAHALRHDGDSQRPFSRLQLVASDFVALGAGELDSALEKYKAATENDPRLAAAFNDLGVLLHAQVSSS